MKFQINFMKRFLFLLVLFVSLLSCKKDDPDNTTPSDSLYTEGGGVTDVDGNTYKTIIITASATKSFSAQQEWMAENLKATKYADGTEIDPFQMAVCNGDSSTISKLGYLYSWNALMNNSNVAGSQGACPNGWHVPTVEEYSTLINNLGGAAVAGKKMKSEDANYWITVETADNTSGFNALGGGFYMSGMYFHYKNVAKFWTSTEEGANGREVQIEGDGPGMFNSYGSSKTVVRSSCRCIKN